MKEPHEHEVTRHNYDKYHGIKYMKTEGSMGQNLVLVKNGKMTGVHIYFEDGYEEKGQILLDNVLDIIQNNLHVLS